MDVSIIFVNYKTKELTINAIKSVTEKTENLEYEIIVVDNNSQDGSIEAIEKDFPYIKIIKNSINSGFGAANNLGIREASGKYILCLNTDTLLLNNAIKILFDYMEQNPTVGICGAQLLNRDLSLQLSYGYFPTFWNLFFKYGFVRKKYTRPQKLTKAIKVDSIVGADLFARKSILDNIGGFDENIFMYGEEVELCYRACKSDYVNMIVPDSKIIHFGGMSSGSEFAFLSTIKGIFYFAYKHKTMPITILRLYFIIKYIFAFLIYRKKIYIEGINLTNKLSHNIN